MNNQQPMTPAKAFDIIVQATGQVSANRETHVAIQMALDVLKELLPKEEEAIKE